MAQTSERIVGIDFGTSTTLVAVRHGTGAPRVLPIGDTTTWMPSILGVGDGGELIAGEAATRLDPRRTLRSIKAELTAGRDQVQTPAGVIDVHDAVRTILTEAMERARRVQPDAFDGSEVFLGCPALWTGRERKLLVEVAQECGLDVDIDQIVDEPVAAGLHWVHSQWLGSGQRPTGKSLIFDAGGGTLDVAYLDVAGIDHPAMTVMSAEGRAESGDELDRTISEHLLRSASDRHGGYDPTFDILLRSAARRLKEALSDEHEASIALGAPYEQIVALRRSSLEELFEPQLQRAVRLTMSAVRGGLLRVLQPESPTAIRQLAWSDASADIEHVALVGGLSQVPVVQRALRTSFPDARVALVADPQESVARGLTHGDALDELNLPRPPVDFRVEYRISATGSDRDHEVVYEAFTPLYTPEDLVRGHSMLGYEAEIPVPADARGTFEIIVRCVVPDRHRSPLGLRFGNGDDSVVADGIRLEHSGERPAKLKLYTNGEFVVTSSKHHFKARVDRWPRLRGPHHDAVREIELEQVGRGGPSQLIHDDWRFQ